MKPKERYYKGVKLLRKINFFAKEKSTELLDSLLDTLSIKDDSIFFKEDKNKIRIVFAGLLPNHRVIKHMKWLNRNGNFEIILLCHKSASFSDLDKNYFGHQIRFRNLKHLKRIINGAKNINLYYAFTSKPSYARPVIEQTVVPTAFDPYDCLIVYYGRNPKQEWMKKEIPDEEFCFANASAAVARNPETRLSYEMFDLKKPQNIFFTDYCDNDYFVNKNLSIENENSKISLVYAGGIYGKSMQKSSHGIENFSYLIDELENQRLHFHIYPSPFTDKETYYDYVEDSRRMKFLHIHETVEQKNLSNELSQYHFGVLPHFKEENFGISDDKLKLGTSLKFFNFLEAGIPVLVSNEMSFMAWMVKRYEIGVVFSKNDIKNLRKIITSSDYAKLKKNVLINRDKLSIKVNLPRLEKFIYGIAAKKLTNAN